MNTITQLARMGFLGQLGSTGDKTGGVRPCLPVLGGLSYSLLGCVGLFGWEQGHPVGILELMGVRFFAGGLE